MRQTQILFERRLRVFEIAALCIFFLLVARLWQLQIIRGDQYYNRSMTNRTALVTISAPRGTITDRNGKVIANNRMAFTISIVPRELGSEVIDRLSPIINMPADEIQRRIAEQNRGRTGPRYQPVRLVEDAPPELVVQIEERRIELPGVIVEEEPYRNYPAGMVAGSVIGYVGQINSDELREFSDRGYRGGDRIGKSGVEREFEAYLRGVDGVKMVEIDSHRRPVGSLGMYEPTQGSTVALTIDLEVQKTAEEALRRQMEIVRAGRYKNAFAGAAVALDPRTGAILAMASEPGYDPNWFVPKISDARWRQVSTGISALFNRAVSGAYPPGSTFKAFTAAAALKAGVVDLNERFTCTPGVADRYFGMRCSVWADGRSHGSQNLIEGMANSCNVVFYELGRRLSADDMAHMARAFGFGHSTGLAFVPRDGAGSAPDSSTKRFTPGERLSYAIGQQVAVTPLQMALAYAGIAMRGPIPVPYLVGSVEDIRGKTVASSVARTARTVRLPEAVWNYLHRSLREVTRVGTAAKAFSGFPVPVAGKTGTAQAPPGDAHGWFAAWAPADNPEIVVVVAVERGGSGGGAAAPVARAIMEAYFAVGRESQKSAEHQDPQPSD